MSKLLFLFLTFSAYTIASPLDGKTASFDDLYRLLLGDDTTQFSNATIGIPAAYYAQGKFLLVRDVKFTFDRARDNSWDMRFSQGGKPLHVYKAVEFLNCEFPLLFWLVVRNITFHQAIGFRNCTNVQMVFRECNFLHNMYIRGCSGNFADFEDSLFGLGFNFAEKSSLADRLTFTRCQFSFDSIYYRSPRTNESQNAIKNLLPVPEYFRFENTINALNLKFNSCDFSLGSLPGDDHLLSLDLNHAVLNTLEILDTPLPLVVDLSFATILNQFKLFNCAPLLQLIAESITFNSANAKVQWDNLRDEKLCVYDPSKKILLSGLNISGTGNEYQYQTLISVYALLYTTYKSQGSKLSANACYVEWKDIETNHLKHLLNHEWSGEVAFSLIMNIFLQMFCDYGTSPGKSMLWSLTVMVFFALLYVVFPRTGGMRESEEFLRRIRAFGEYFTAGKSLYQIECSLSARIDETADEREDLRTFVQQNKTSLPLYYRMLGVKLARIKHLQSSLQQVVARLGDGWLGAWNTLGKKRRVRVAIVFGFGLIVTLSGAVFLRFLDAFFLSINAFSTLGFGEIPVRGAAKYFAIAEGFIGWFLLSIFSVALISQIIQ